MPEVLITDYLSLFRSGLSVGMLTAVGAGLGGMLIHYSSKMFKVMAGG